MDDCFRGFRPPVVQNSLHRETFTMNRVRELVVVAGKPVQWLAQDGIPRIARRLTAAKSASPRRARQRSERSTF
jgi:hypothetical protein